MASFDILDNETDESLKEQLTELHARLDGVDTSIVELEKRIGELNGGGGSGGAGISEELEKQLQREITYSKLANHPNFVKQIETGLHQDDTYHEYGGWGTIITVQEPVKFCKAQVHARDTGTLRMQLYEMRYEENTAYDRGRKLSQLDIPINESGVSTIYPELVIPTGTYFLTRRLNQIRSAQVVPLKRVRKNVNWDEFNDNHELPMRFECSWQKTRLASNTEPFQEYKDRGWDQILHYYANMEWAHL